MLIMLSFFFHSDLILCDEELDKKLNMKQILFHRVIERIFYLWKNPHKFNDFFSVLTKSLTGHIKQMLWCQMKVVACTFHRVFLRVLAKLTSHGFHLMINFVILSSDPGPILVGRQDCLHFISKDLNRRGEVAPTLTFRY